MSSRARAYNDGATGARSNAVTRSPQAPAISGPTGKQVRFDGQDGSVLIDRKSGVATTQKSVNQAMRQSEALRHNGMTGRWEVPDQRSFNRANRVLEKAEVDNITVEIVPR